MVVLVKMHHKFGSNKYWVRGLERALLQFTIKSDISQLGSENRLRSEWGSYFLFPSPTLSFVFMMYSLSLSVSQIEKDLLRTMPTNACFSSLLSVGVPRLRRVLRGLAWLYPDIGYCQGTGMVSTEPVELIKYTHFHTAPLCLHCPCVFFSVIVLFHCLIPSPFLVSLRWFPACSFFWRRRMPYGWCVPWLKTSFLRPTSRPHCWVSKRTRGFCASSLFSTCQPSTACCRSMT